MTDYPARDAVEAPPWNDTMGPRPRVTVYPPGHRPLLHIHTAREWRQAVVAMRHDWADGRVAYHVNIWLPGTGIGSSVRRSYWWDSAAMQKG